MKTKKFSSGVQVIVIKFVDYNWEGNSVAFLIFFFWLYQLYKNYIYQDCDWAFFIITLVRVFLHPRESMRPFATRAREISTRDLPLIISASPPINLSSTCLESNIMRTCSWANFFLFDVSVWENIDLYV